MVTTSSRLSGYQCCTTDRPFGHQPPIQWLQSCTVSTCGYQPTSHQWMVYIHGPFWLRTVMVHVVTNLPVTGGWCIFTVHLVTDLPPTYQSPVDGPFGYQSPVDGVYSWSIWLPTYRSPVDGMVRLVTNLPVTSGWSIFMVHVATSYRSTTLSVHWYIQAHLRCFSIFVNTLLCPV